MNKASTSKRTYLAPVHTNTPNEETLISNEDLMRRVQKGDHQAFSDLVRRNSSMFYACAYRVCGDQDEAEDAVQDAFLKLWRNPMAWKANRNTKFTTWFYTVVVNATKDRLRKKRMVSSDEIVNRVSDTRAIQDENMQTDERQKALEQAILNLPERQKLAVTLCFNEGLSNKEAAEIIGVGVKALESLLMRAKAALKDMMIIEGFIEKGKKYG